MPVSLSVHLPEAGYGTFLVKTHLCFALLLTRPNFLIVSLVFTPPWIFNYTDEELGKHPSLHFSLYTSDSQVEIPHLSNMGAAPVTVHLITLGPALSPDATQCHAAYTCYKYAHTLKIKMNFLATYGEEGGWWWWWQWRFGWWRGWCRGERNGRGMEGGWERMGGRAGAGGGKLSFPNCSLIFRG